ncbi:glycosyltransferase family 2 protein [Streptacidiphilus sp. PAMC 29251]
MTRDLVQLLTYLLLAYSAFLLLRFLVYWAGAHHWYRVRQPFAPGDPAAFSWHFMVPCRDEEAVVGRTVAGLRASFPASRVWVVDDASEDRTRAIVLALMAEDPRLHLVRRALPEARTGKGAALNAAYRAIGAWLPPDTDRSKVVLCVVDADGRLAPNALAAVSGPEVFGRPETGGVQIGVRIRNVGEPTPLPGRGRLANARGRALVRMQDIEFSTSNAAMQMLRRHLGSVGMGGNGQFARLSAVDAITPPGGGPWPEQALLEDYESGLELRLSGQQLVYVHDTHVDQEGLSSTRRFLTQRARWAQGNLQCLRYTRRVLRSPVYTLRGKLEVVYTFLQPVSVIALTLLTVLTLLGVVLTWLWIPPEIRPWANSLHWPFLLAFVLAVTPLVLWGFAYRSAQHPEAPWLAGLVWGIGMWLYLYHLFPASLTGIWRIVRGRNGWAKTRRNAEPLGNGPVARSS